MRSQIPQAMLQKNHCMVTKPPPPIKIITVNFYKSVSFWSYLEGWADYIKAWSECHASPKKFEKRPLGYHRFQRHGYDRGRGMSGSIGVTPACLGFLYGLITLFTLLWHFVYILCLQKDPTPSIFWWAIIGFHNNYRTEISSEEFQQMKRNIL